MNFSFHQTNTKPWISPRYQEPTRALYIPLDQTQCTTFRWRGTHHNGHNLHALSSRARHGDVECIIILMMLSCSCWGFGAWGASLGPWPWLCRDQGCIVAMVCNVVIVIVTLKMLGLDF